MVNWTRPRTCN